MYLEEDSFDALYSEVCRYVIEKGKPSAPRGLQTYEIMGAMLRINNPRTRLLQNNIRNLSIPFAIAEWLWCMKGSNQLDMIQYYAPSYYKYSDDGTSLHGAYGPRLITELSKIISLLQNDPDSRRALIPIYSSRDVGLSSKDIPCTSNIQFFIREGSLDMFVHMRSNDIYLGLPYDVFNFTMLQEYMANKLNLRLGKYTHVVNSFHVYEAQISKVQKIARSDSAQSIEMKEMPLENLEMQIELLKFAEHTIRNGTELNIPRLDPYFEWFKDELVKYSQKKAGVIPSA